jgi:hypothetical protein
MTGWFENSVGFTKYWMPSPPVSISVLYLVVEANENRGSGTGGVEKRFGSEDRSEKANRRRRGSSWTSNDRGSVVLSPPAPVPPPRVNVCVRKPFEPNVKTARQNFAIRVVLHGKIFSLPGPPPKLVAKPGPNALPPPPKNMLNKSSGLSSPSKRAFPPEAKPEEREDIPPYRSSGSVPLSYTARF